MGGTHPGSISRPYFSFLYIENNVGLKCEGVLYCLPLDAMSHLFFLLFSFVLHVSIARLIPLYIFARLFPVSIFLTVYALELGYFFFFNLFRDIIKSLQRYVIDWVREPMKESMNPFTP